MNNFWKKKSLYNPSTSEPFRLSRSKIDLFLECARCFYLDRRSGIARPSFPAFSLNSAVDVLLKKEFDLLRDKRQPHELMKTYQVDAIPYQHPDLSVWRENFKGIDYHHQPTNFVVSGAIDDVWINPSGELIIVDYKSTSTEKEISLEDEFKQGYKLQMEVYQWLFRQRGFRVADTGYFVFANAGKNRPSFDGKLEFELSLIPHKGDTRWIEPTLLSIKQCLDSDKSPSLSANCEYCQWRQKVE